VFYVYMAVPYILNGQVKPIINGGYLEESLTTVVDFSEGEPEILRVGEG